MTLTSLLVHDVTVLTAGSTTDRYGATVKDWGNATERDVRGWVSQREALEDRTDGREAQIQGWILYLPAGDAITGHNRVRWNDPTPAVTFEVDGPPDPAWSPRGEHHIEVRLRVVDG